MADTFRLLPPAVRSEWIERPRVVQVLDRRFELDVLTVVAPAGYGKTTALAQALAANDDQARGLDVWLQCSPADGDADVLGAALLVATGLPEPGAGFVGSAGRVADAVLRLAPQPVCLVLDDLHLLDPDSDGMALLDELVGCLPTNGHLLLSGRTRPPLRTARLRAGGRAEEVVADDLAFDDEEVDRVLPGVGDPTVVRWPAMATLLGGGRDGDTVDFLLEEVVTALDEERVAVLAALAHVRTVDDDLARAASKGEYDAAELLGQLPLVHRTAVGTFQMHDLWREAFAAAHRGPAVSRALGRIAEHRQAEKLHLEAAELFAAAGDPDGVGRAAEALAIRPLMFATVGDLRQMAALASSTIPDRPITAVLRASVAMTGDERASAAAFEDAADAARAAGDVRVEAIALTNAANMHGVVNPYGFPAWLADRAGDLAEAGDPLGAALSATLRALAARAESDPERAVELLRAPAGNGVGVPRVQYAFAMCDLGRPEEVAASDDTEDAGAAGGQYLAQAIWLRGDLPPEVALEVGRSLAEPGDHRQVAHVQISTNGVLSLVAVAADDPAEARRFADRAASWTGQTGSRYVQSFIALADAATVLVEERGEAGEAAAAERLARMLDLVPVEPWPYRAYLYALPLLYLLAPRVRAPIDGCRFGSALTAAQRAGQALVALRERDDPGPAQELPWHRPNLLRAHVPPPFLGELAASAAAAGHGAVSEVLAQLPSPRENLQTATLLGHVPTASWAQARVAQLPARPDYDLHVEALGSLTMTRGGTLITDEAWSRRERVRQLLAYLLLHRRAGRRRAAEDLWPDLALDRALQNLRVNLSHLQRVLQPSREAEAPAWFVRAEADLLEVAPAGFEVDTEVFERACLDARRLDEQAKGSLAIAGYRVAAALYRGDYLQDWPDAEWAAPERVRLRALATGAICRLGELVLARGEPEEATAWATAVLRHEPLLERGHRLFVRGLAGQGNRPASVEAVRDLIRRLEAERLQPEPETVRLAESLGVA